MLATRKIGEMADMLISYDNIQRIGKSYIFNLSLVKSIDTSKITFAAHDPIVVKLGASYIKRIQAEIIRDRCAELSKDNNTAVFVERRNY